MSVRLGAVEEDDLVLVRAAAEEDLLHLVAPLRRRLVAEHRHEREVRALALEPGAHPEPRLRIGLGDVARVEVVDAIRSHHVEDAAERVELRPQLGVERDRGVEQKPLAGEPNHGHPRSDGEPVERLRPLGDPDVLRQRPEPARPSEERSLQS